ncbi:conserved hypothetical protein [Theileria equi strain WA]|uniref:Mitochondrial pyruvate carrier n=1 Tax=Theileria equi strain WA TaxID=1537102 RepID=L1LCP1_THEEQ|nr:conserved hypothetical protein [Theileria equi strain WA]EKX73202.1 conserved hypothetical protein [Theileria equi strain WA]|eukprot:XP_004832654.1 conserved hypothetical protein [Theileria equi strain WA]
MAGVFQKIFYPGIAPFLQSKVLALPLPEKVKSFIVHPAGPFTIHFYAPTFKWAISIANLSDINRPTELISLPQQIAVAATGLIWSRYSTVITPVNYNLLSVNAAMAVTGIYQISRICRDRLSPPQKN